MNIKSSPALDVGGPIIPGSGESIRRQVEARLRECIQNVRLAPGTTLPENELSQALAVSRTPLREALQRLAHDGLIMVVPQVGTFVAKIDLNRVREALFVREAVECTALMRVAKLKPHDHAALKNLLDMHAQAVAAGDTDKTLHSDEAFHRYLLALGGVPGSWRYVQEAREMHRRVRIVAQQSSGEAARTSVEQHVSILEHLRGGRVDEAIELLRSHIRMNFALAQRLAATHPDYFVASSLANHALA